MNFETKNISVADLKEGIQIRVETNPETVRRYIEAIEKKGGSWPFPPIDVYRIDGELHIADGHHRWKAAQAAGLETILCLVRDGGTEDLLKTAFKGNSRNALQMTDADLKHGRELAIQMFPNKSDRELAEICDCSAMTINRAKKELEESGRYERPETVIGRDGKERKSTVTMLQYKAKPEFNLEDFRKRCLEIRNAAVDELFDLSAQLSKLDGWEVEEESEEERAAHQARREAEKKEFEKKWWFVPYMQHPDDGEIYLFSELLFDGDLYFAYFISSQNGKPELLVKGWKARYRQIRDTEAEERIKAKTGETKEIYCLEPPFFDYTVERSMTPAEYLIAERIQFDAPTGEPCKCNFFQELWAFKVLDEYRRITT